MKPVRVDKAGWQAFLGLLKRPRARQPLNGVLVAIDRLHDALELFFPGSAGAESPDSLSAAASPRSASRLPSTTAKPILPSSRAVSKPIPLPPPVTSTTLSFSLGSLRS